MASIDPKTKQSTMVHMNKDHQLDLGLYLRHVNGLSAEQLAAEGTPELVDMDLTALHIRTATTGTVHVVALDPPLASWAERRTRLVAMAMDARKAFGVPLPEHGAEPTAATAVVPYPSLGLTELVAFGAVGLYVVQVGLVYGGWDAAVASQWARGLAAAGVPRDAWLAGPEGFRRLVRGLAVPVLLIHMSEAWWFQRTRLAPRGMRWSGKTARDWWLWMGTTFVIGVFSFRRFRALAQAAGKKVEQKH